MEMNWVTSEPDLHAWCEFEGIPLCCRISDWLFSVQHCLDMGEMLRYSFLFMSSNLLVIAMRPQSRLLLSRELVS